MLNSCLVQDVLLTKDGAGRSFSPGCLLLNVRRPHRLCEPLSAIRPSFANHAKGLFATGMQMRSRCPTKDLPAVSKSGRPEDRWPHTTPRNCPSSSEEWSAGRGSIGLAEWWWCRSKLEAGRTDTLHLRREQFKKWANDRVLAQWRSLSSTRKNCRTLRVKLRGILVLAQDQPGDQTCSPLAPWLPTTSPWPRQTFTHHCCADFAMTVVDRCQCATVSILS